MGRQCGVYEATPFGWIELPKILSAFSSALTVHNVVKGFSQLKGLVRDLALDLAALLSMLGLRADIVTREISVGNRSVRVTYFELLDCNCETLPGKEAIKIKCDCRDRGVIEYNVKLTCVLESGLNRK